MSKASNSVPIAETEQRNVARAVDSTLSSTEIQAIVGGYHGTPHAVLGPHWFQKSDGSRVLVIRTFRPLEKCVYLLEKSSGQRTQMRRIDKAGLFEIEMPDRAAFGYRFLLVDNDKNEHEIEDAYAFPFFLTEFDLHLHGEGKLFRAYEKLGAHFRTAIPKMSGIDAEESSGTVTASEGESPTLEAIRGVNFAVWAPNAQRVSVIGPFNGWDNRVHAMSRRNVGGIWEIFIPGLAEGTEYKLSIKSEQEGYEIDKTDPYAFATELRPNTAARIWDLDKFEWGDSGWMAERSTIQALDRPLNIYEVHLGSWRRTLDDNGFLNYRDLAHQLVDYVQKMGYTHIELLPVSEHPLDGSWGYQVTGYFAPTSRFGTPDDFMYFVDYCHRHNIGVLLDWVPAHFPKDAHGLAFFDGTHLYEHHDPRRGEHRDWGTKIFNFGRNEVRNFLLSNALFWLQQYHIDGLRVDAVASMLYLDYSRESGDWVPNKYGGRENLEALDFIRKFNELVHAEAPGTLTIAEESTSWPMVTQPTYTGGLGFDLKWNMGWMHDTLEYMGKDPIYRRYHHDKITFSLIYAFSENFLLPFSHDEVVHLKRSMLDKMPGDLWQKFANLRLLYAFMVGHPGKKLLFMGSEFGQWREWNEAISLDWHLLDQREHRQLQEYVAQLNALYLHELALYQNDFDWEGFAWIDISDVDQSIVSFVRRATDPSDLLIFVCNFTPTPRHGYRVGLPSGGTYREVFNSDWPQFGGSGVENNRGVAGIVADELSWQKCDYSVALELPPLGVLILKPEL